MGLIMALIISFTLSMTEIHVYSAQFTNGNAKIEERGGEKPMRCKVECRTSALNYH